MTEYEELKNEIHQVVMRYISVTHPRLIHSHDDVFLTNKILSIIAERCWLKVDLSEGDTPIDSFWALVKEIKWNGG